MPPALEAMRKASRTWPEDLVLAQGEGLQARRHPQQVAHGVGAGVLVARSVHLGFGNAVEAGDEFRDSLEGILPSSPGPLSP